MTEMWDAEPDCRITSGCARDRMLRIEKVLQHLDKQQSLSNGELDNNNNNNNDSSNYHTTFELLAKNLM